MIWHASLSEPNLRKMLLLVSKIYPNFIQFCRENEKVKANISCSGKIYIEQKDLPIKFVKRYKKLALNEQILTS